VRWVSHVGKPFHQVKVQLSDPGHEQEFLYLTNMAIAVVSADTLDALSSRERGEAAVSRTEFFELVGRVLRDRFYFDVHAYLGSWTHADTDEDLALINKMPLPRLGRRS
jgi:hypothetical protein